MSTKDDARGSWPRLAAGGSRVRASAPGAELKTADRSLAQGPDGRSTWIEDRVWRAPDGAWLFARAVRREGGEPEEWLLVPAATPEGLVAALRERLGMTPGLVEVLGRAGIEVGLEPDRPED